MGVPVQTRRVKLSDDFSVEVRELTVGEIRNWMAEAEAKEEARKGGKAEDLDVVDFFLREDLSIPDLARMTDLTKDQLDDLPQSAISKLVAAAKELNPDFFGMIGRLSKLAGQMRELSGIDSGD